MIRSDFTGETCDENVLSRLHAEAFCDKIQTIPETLPITGFQMLFQVIFLETYGRSTLINRLSDNVGKKKQMFERKSQESKKGRKKHEKETL